MTTRNPDRPDTQDTAERRPADEQGFVRSGDVYDRQSQAEAPEGPGRPFDRSGEKRYEHALRDFERTHPSDQPTAAPHDDQGAVRDAIYRELSGDAELRGVVVAARAGRVTLSGEVADAAARQRAQDLAAAASGVDEVVNHIIVRA